MRHSHPRHDDVAAYDVAFGLYLYPAMLIAHRLGIFRCLGEGRRTLGELSEAVGLARRPTEALVSACVSLGFAERRDGNYMLTTLGEDLLLERSPTYFGAFWDLMYENSDTFSLQGLEGALRRDAPRAYGNGDIFRSHEQQMELGMHFTRAMQSLSAAHAPVWPTKIDLSQHRIMLDVGGGSGAHVVGALAAWPSLRGVLFDLPAVCQMSRAFLDQSTQGRLELHAGDMWHDPFPPADLHFYSNIFHDWTLEKNGFLARKSFNALPSGGQIVLHEVLYHNDRSGPPAAAAFSLMMMGWTEGEQYTAEELDSVLSKAGFTSVRILPSLGHYSLVTAVKS